MDAKDSAALLRAAKEGSAEALDRLYERCAGKLLALIRLRMGRDLRAHMESRDILQATLLKSFRSIDQLEKDGTGSLMAWLARIAQNEIRDQADYLGRLRRDAAKEVPLPEDHDPGGLVAERVHSALSQLILDERMERLERALESLDGPHREIILLRKYEELSFGEIARRLDKSEDACRMMLARAMTALTLRVAEER
jgi:RNA polymerase sigma-70 factor (ECF subfamily)